jgi:RHS repeat-associated protein
MSRSDVYCSAIEYTPYGYFNQRTEIPASVNFCGEVFEEVAGVYFLGMGTRTYSPSLLRFLSCDTLSPFGLGGVNAYCYCLGDPVNLTDPTGRSPLLLRPLKLVLDSNWTLSSRPSYVQKQFRWGRAAVKTFESTDQSNFVQKTTSFHQPLQESNSGKTSSRRDIATITINPRGYNGLQDSTTILLKAYIRRANQHNLHKSQGVRNLPAESTMTHEFIQNFGEARRLRSALKSHLDTLPDGPDRSLVIDVLNVRL